VLRRIFGPKRKEVAENWRLHNKELHNLCPSPNIIRVVKSRRLRQAGNIGLMEKMRNAYTILFVIPEGKRPLGRPRHRWGDNIKMMLRKYGGKVWTGFIWLTTGASGGPS